MYQTLPKGFTDVEDSPVIPLLKKWGAADDTPDGKRERSNVETPTDVG